MQKGIEVLELPKGYVTYCEELWTPPKLTWESLVFAYFCSSSKVDWL